LPTGLSIGGALATGGWCGAPGGGGGGLPPRVNCSVFENLSFLNPKIFNIKLFYSFYLR
jgi:hypothetical protein